MDRYTLSPTLLSARKKRAQRITKILQTLFPNPKIALKYNNNWELLVSVVLSAQCTDKKVNEVTQTLFSKYRTLDDYVHADLEEFQQDIHSTGFYRNKGKNILQSARIVKEAYGGKLPETMKEMLTLPGIARKSANVILGNAFGVVEGIAVDTHVIRLSQRLGLTTASDPVNIERDLMQIIPQKNWFTFTYLIIDYGRTYCAAKPHRHELCPLKDFDDPTFLKKHAKKRRVKNTH